MKLIHGNVSLFSHLLLGAGLLLPVILVQPGLWLGSGAGWCSWENLVGDKVLKNGNSGDTRGKRKVKVCWSSLERGRGLFLGVKGEKGTFPCGFGASPVRDVEPGEAARAVRGRGDAL